MEILFPGVGLPSSLADPYIISAHHSTKGLAYPPNVASFSFLLFPGTPIFLQTALCQSFKTRDVALSISSSENLCSFLSEAVFLTLSINLKIHGMVRTDFFNDLKFSNSLIHLSPV